MGTYAIDGVQLDDAAGRWVVSEETQLGGLPGSGLTSASVPGRHGVLPLPARVRGPGSRTVGVLVTDNDAAGVPTGDHQQLNANLAALFALAAPLGRLPVLEYFPEGYSSAGLMRSAPVRLLAEVEPVLHDYLTAEVVLPFDLPGTFWRETTEHTFDSGAVSSWTVVPPGLDGCTGAIVDPLILVQGPLTSVQVTDAASGKSLSWSGVVTAGQWLRLDPENFVAWRTTTETWTGGVAVSGGLSTGAHGFDLNPDKDLEVGWTLTRSGGAGVNKLKCRRSFL